MTYSNRGSITIPKSTIKKFENLRTREGLTWNDLLKKLYNGIGASELKEIKNKPLMSQREIIIKNSKAGQKQEESLNKVDSLFD